MAETVLVEILSADPIGPLSLSQGRTAVQGDILARLAAFSGAEVRREYYVNDMGQRAASLCDSVRHCILSNTEGDAVEGRYDVTVRHVSDQLLSMRGAALHDATDEEWKELCGSIPQLLLQSQRATLERLGVTYDSWFEERELAPQAVDSALNRLRENGHVTEQGRALWLTGKAGDRVLLRRDSGAFTYFAVDIAYHLSKVERGATRMLDVWGPAYHRHRHRLLDAMTGLEVQVPLEVIVTGDIRLENDGMAVVYLDAASVMLDPLLEHGSAAGLRFLLNSAAPEADLVLSVSQLNAVGLPPAVSAARALLNALGMHEEDYNRESLQASLGSPGGRRPNPTALMAAVSRTPAVLEDAYKRRRPDLLNEQLVKMQRAYAAEGGDTLLASLGDEEKTALAAALQTLLRLTGLNV